MSDTTSNSKIDVNSDAKDGPQDKAKRINDVKKSASEKFKSYKPLFARYVGDRENILSDNVLLRFVAIISFAMTAVCLTTMLSQGDKTRTIIVPFAGGKERIWITGDQPSDSYFMSISRNIISLLGTFTASNADHQFDELLQYVHPSEYDARRLEWRALAKEMLEFRDVTFATYVRTNEPIIVFDKILKVPVTRTRFVGSTRTKETGIVEIGYLIEEGRFWMTTYDFRLPGSVQNRKSEDE